MPGMACMHTRYDERDHHQNLSLIHISEPTRQAEISQNFFFWVQNKKKKKKFLDGRTDGRTDGRIDDP